MSTSPPLGHFQYSLNPNLLFLQTFYNSDKFFAQACKRESQSLHQTMTITRFVTSFSSSNSRWDCPAQDIRGSEIWPLSTGPVGTKSIKQIHAFPATLFVHTKVKTVKVNHFNRKKEKKINTKSIDISTIRINSKSQNQCRTEANTFMHLWFCKIFSWIQHEHT